MKRHKLYTLLLAGLVTLGSTSCSNFLEEEDKVEVEKKNYLTNADEAQNVLLGVYRTNVREAMYGRYLSIHFSLGTDMEQVEGSNTENFRIVPTNAYPATQSEVQQAWQSLYMGIYNANDFLEQLSLHIDSYSQSDKKKALIYAAEARSLRALYYFELVRRWNRVPLFTNTEQSHQKPETFVQAEPAEVYKFIEEDLKYAAEILPYATDDDVRSDNSYRFSKGAALGLLAKVYATWAGYTVNDTSKWKDAAETAAQLINSGKHDLLPDFETLWENTANGVWDPTESLIEISFYSPTAAGGANDPCGYIGKWNGVPASQISGTRGSCKGNVKVIYPFSYKWQQIAEQKGDKRWALSISNFQYKPTKTFFGKAGQYTIGDEKVTLTAEEASLNPDVDQKNKQYFTPAKWDLEKYTNAANKLINDDRSNTNWYVLRYADVLLIYAEALNEWKGYPTNEAYAAINKVRRRGFGNPSNTSVCDLPAALSQEAFRQAVRDERAYELAFEGHRRLDLVRWGIYYQTITKTYKDLLNWWSSDNENFNYAIYQYTIEGKHELMPIPQRDMDLCPQFKQNPKW